MFPLSEINRTSIRTTFSDLKTLPPRNLLLPQQRPVRLRRKETLPSDLGPSHTADITQTFFTTLSSVRGAKFVAGVGEEQATEGELKNALFILMRLRENCFQFWEEFADYQTKVAKSAKDWKRGKLMRLCDQLLLDVSGRMFVLALLHYRERVVESQQAIDNCGDRCLKDLVFWKMAGGGGGGGSAVLPEGGERMGAQFGRTDDPIDVDASSRLAFYLKNVDFWRPLRLSQISEIFGISSASYRERDSVNCVLRTWQKMCMSRPRLLALKDHCLPSETFLTSLMTSTDCE